MMSFISKLPGLPYAIAIVLVTSAQSQNAPGHLGCFGDPDSAFSRDRALFQIGPEDSDDQSVEWCFRYCWDTLSSNYRYAGLEFAKECFCGNNEDYGRHGERTDCQDVCTGNSDQICGDSDRISIYRISQGVCSNDIGPPTNGSHSITNPRSLAYNLNNFKFFGTRVDFYCDDGYTLNGASSIECIDTGYNNVTWSDTVPTCEETISVTPTAISTTSIDTSQKTTSGYGANRGQFPTGLIIGIAFGLTMGIIGFATIVIIFRKKRQKKLHPDTPLVNAKASYSNATDDYHAAVEDPVQPLPAAVPEYSQVHKPHDPQRSNAYATPDDVITLSNDNTCVKYYQQENDSHTYETSVDVALSGRETGQMELEAARDVGGTKDQTDTAPPLVMKGKPGWVENIIYE